MRALLDTSVVAVGRRPRARAMDLLIAATAHTHDARLYTRYTRNQDDLRGLHDLVEVVPV